MRSKKSDFKNVLFISYFFPPCGGGGVQRSSKFVKYLPKFDWKPYILTVRKWNLPLDISLLKDIPVEAEVFETFSLEELFIKDKQSEYAINCDAYCNGSSFNNNPIKRSITRIKNFINKYIFQPDSAILWFPFAIVRGTRIIRHHKIDLIYATGSPWSALIIGATLKMITSRPLVIDLRDPWSIHENKKFLDPLFEKITFIFARSILLNTDDTYNEYTRLYPQYAFKMKTITNGYDKEDFISLKPSKVKRDKYQIVHAGSIQNPATFINAVQLLFNDKPEIATIMEILIIGVPYDLPQIPPKLNNIIKIMQYKPHTEILRYISSADLLLIIRRPGMHNKWTIPAKVFEYFATQKPILAIVPEESPLFKLIKETNTGTVVEFTDVQSIKNHLEGYIKGDYHHEPKTELFSQFERSKLTSNLADVFNKCVSENE